jgi:hypothetical protein
MRELLFFTLLVSTAGCAGTSPVVEPPPDVVADSLGGQVPVGVTIWTEPSAEEQGVERVAVPVVTPDGDLLIPAGSPIVSDVIEIAGVRQPLDVTMIERRGSLVGYRLNQPIESYASLTYRRFQ